jgi:hypothetical protein
VEGREDLRERQAGEGQGEDLVGPERAARSEEEPGGGTRDEGDEEKSAQPGTGEGPSLPARRISTLVHPETFGPPSGERKRPSRVPDQDGPD